MDEKGKSLLRLLFNEGETICVSNSKYGFHSIPLENSLDGDIALLSPNESIPNSQCKSSELVFTAINPINGFRTDANVTAFRSFLWEIDSGSIPEQLGYFKQLKIPLSAQIFSGNKSVHAVTVLDEDIEDEKRYRFLYQWALNILTWCDQNCKNPSRSIRIPGSYRELGKKQRLIWMGRRVSQKEFINWLNNYKDLMPLEKKRESVPTGASDYSRLTPWCRGMLEKGLIFKDGRNKTWFSLAVDCAKAGFNKEETISLLGKKFVEEYDFKEKEWLASINSAFKYVGEGKG